MTKKIPIAIIGASGYTGVELVRLLLGHPYAQIVSLTSRQYAGKSYAQVFPAFKGRLTRRFEKFSAAAIAKKAKVAFLCLPHHESMKTAAQLLQKGMVVIDLSADFRLRDAKVYEAWYGKHSHKPLLKKAVYGLPEFYRSQITKANLIASPGCYPTSVILGLAPLVKNKLIQLDNIISDSKSGVSGAGRALKTASHFDEANDSFKAYGVAGHRHQPEMEQELSALAGKKVKLVFTPHLVPMDRGILSTIYATPLKKLTTAKLIKLYQDFYQHEGFVHVLGEGCFPTTKDVRGSNNCHIGVHYNVTAKRLVIISAIDNLTKGASGQAVQSFNIRFGFDEPTGLSSVGLIP